VSDAINEGGVSQKRPTIPASIPILVDLDPVSVRVLKVNLLHAVRSKPDLARTAVAIVILGSSFS
jgi:hypothetical protein